MRVGLSVSVAEQWLSNARNLRAAGRDRYAPGIRHDYDGFRVVSR